MNNNPNRLPTSDQPATTPIRTTDQPVKTTDDSSSMAPPLRPQSSKKPRGQKSGWHDFLSTVAILGTAFLVAIFMITFIFRSYQVDGPSMETTLQNTDKLIIWKVPRTIARITGTAYIPNRGDVIVFEESGLSAFGQSDKKQLIKRVTGLPGDHVIVKNGVLTIYNRDYPKGFQPDKTLAYGKVIPETSGDVDVTLKADQLFVNGDNRPDSLDSRAFGPINANQVIGKLAVRIFPISKAEVF